MRVVRVGSSWLLVAMITAGSIVACVGEIEDLKQQSPGGAAPSVEPDAGTSSAALCNGPPSPGPSPMRRLTNREYDNTVRDLVGDDSAHGHTFAAEEDALGFKNNADALTVSELLAEQYMRAAEAIADRATTNLPKLLGCGGDSCIRDFVTKFGKRAWRRPLQPKEVDALLALYTKGKATDGVRGGAARVIEALLQSPHFLYRVEQSDTLSDYEMASRLSYLIWGSMPDDALFAKAAAGTLKTKDQLLAEAERMLADPKARDMVVSFHDQWLHLEEIEVLDKAVELFPGYVPELRPLMRKETEEMVAHAVLDDGGTLETLLTANYSYMNKTLAGFYGVPGATRDDVFTKVTLDPGRSAGVLTHAGLLSILAKPNQGSPVLRGKFIRERMLCQTPPPPPPNIDVTPPDLDPKLTTRERFAQHSADPLCKGCHRLMDPVGLGFEHYDGVGRWREKENGLPIDASGELVDTDVAEPKFNGVTELGKKLASSNQVRDCVVLQWFRHSVGRSETKEDGCSLSTLREKFRASGGNVKQLILDMTQTDAFLYRSGGKP